MSLNVLLYDCGEDHYDNKDDERSRTLFVSPQKDDSIAVVVNQSKESKAMTEKTSTSNSLIMNGKTNEISLDYFLWFCCWLYD